MSIGQSLLPEFDQEMASTRKVLERIPGDKLDWKAHPKSNTIGWVGTHLANIPGWTVMTLKTESLDIAPPGGEPFREPKAESVKAILDLFDRNVAEGRATLAAAGDEEFFKPWTLLSGGSPVFTMPRMAVLRSFVLNHMIHHRAHLCVYLRLNDVPVPGLYGPSADDAAGM
jgi:uncharacterized damage-inducible protein DinB